MRRTELKRKPAKRRAPVSVEPPVGSRLVRAERVFEAKDGREFIQKRVRYPSGTVGMRRVYGVVMTCQECERPFFQREVRRGRGFCSHSCEKRGERNPARRTMRANGKVAKATADKWFSLIIRSSGQCYQCGESDPRQLQCAHIFSRRYLDTRWDEDNALCLCAACHMFFTHRPIEWEDFVSEEIGWDAYLRLRARAIKVTKPDYVELLDRLMSRMTELGLST